MHPTKAKMLASIDRSSAIVDRAIHRNFRVVAAPHEHGALRFGTALITLPLYAISAVLGDPTYVIIARTEDDVWERLPPLDPPGD